MDLSWFEIGAIMLLVSMLVFAFCIVIVITLNTRASDMSIDMKNTLYHYSTARYLLNKYPLRVSDIF